MPQLVRLNRVHGHTMNDEQRQAFIDTELLPNPNQYAMLSADDQPPDPLRRHYETVIHALADELVDAKKSINEHRTELIYAVRRNTRQARLIGFMQSMIRSGETIESETLTELVSYALAGTE